MFVSKDEHAERRVLKEGMPLRIERLGRGGKGLPLPALRKEGGRSHFFSICPRRERRLETYYFPVH